MWMVFKKGRIESDGECGVYVQAMRGRDYPVPCQYAASAPVLPASLAVLETDLPGPRMGRRLVAADDAIVDIRLYVGYSAVLT